MGLWDALSSFVAILWSLLGTSVDLGHIPCESRGREMHVPNRQAAQSYSRRLGTLIVAYENVDANFLRVVVSHDPC